MFRLFKRQSFATVQPIRKAASGQVVHDQIAEPRLRVLPDTMNGDQVRMPDLDGEFTLAQKPFAKIRVLLRRVRIHHLHRIARAFRYARKVHRPHGALAKQLHDGVVADLVALFEEACLFLVIHLLYADLRREG